MVALPPARRIIRIAAVLKSCAAMVSGFDIFPRANTLTKVVSGGSKPLAIIESRFMVSPDSKCAARMSRFISALREPLL